MCRSFIIEGLIVVTICKLHALMKLSDSVFFMPLFMQLFLLPGMPSPPHTRIHMSQSFKSQLKCHLLYKAFPNSPLPGKLEVIPPSSELPQHSIRRSSLIYHFPFCCYTMHKPSVQVFSPLYQKSESMLYSFLFLPWWPCPQ